MAFFTDSSGTEIQPSTEFVGGGFQPLIPTGTELRCLIAAANWEEPTDWYDASLAKVMLMVIEHGPYRNFTVFDKIKCADPDAKKADKAITKLMTYDTLCKGLLLKSDKAGKAIIANDSLLEKALVGGEVIATFNVWEMENERTGKIMTGNNVTKISSAAKVIQLEDKKIIEKAENHDTDFDFDDSILF